MLNVRMVTRNDLPALQELYSHLHDQNITPVTPEQIKIWEEILRTPGYYILIGDYMGQVVSSVTIIIIKNLTRNMRPYALIENVVTAPDYRKKGCAGLLMKKAAEIAEKNDCYKIMLLTGSKKESTLDFYRKAGFSDTEKTGFVMRL